VQARRVLEREGRTRLVEGRAVGAAAPGDAERSGDRDSENGEGPETDRYYRATINSAQGGYRFDQVPIYVRGDFEGPLRAVLNQKAGALYKGAMDIKGKTMSLIMNSPLIHNAVEFGRAFPAMPTRIIKAYFDGNRAKNDRGTRRNESSSRSHVGGLYRFGFRPNRGCRKGAHRQTYDLRITDV
jgi:hypothetical protein